MNSFKLIQKKEKAIVIQTVEEELDKRLEGWAYNPNSSSNTEENHSTTE